VVTLGFQRSIERLDCPQPRNFQTTAAVGTAITASRTDPYVQSRRLVSTRKPPLRAALEMQPNLWRIESLLGIASGAQIARLIRVRDA